MVAVVAAALATKGRAKVPAANSPTEPRNTERRVVVFIRVFLPWHGPSAAASPSSLRGDILKEPNSVLNRYRTGRTGSIVIAAGSSDRAPNRR
jgi:hypothetical protein